MSRAPKLQAPVSKGTLEMKIKKGLDFEGYQPRRFVPAGIYTGESWANVRAGGLNPARPRIRSAV